MLIFLVPLLIVVALTVEAARADAPAAAAAPVAVVAVLDEPGMPLRGCRSAPGVVAEILADAGMQAHRLSAAELADPQVFSRQRFDMVVLPCGETFPAAARDSLLQFLRAGGDLVTMGGYAFQDLVRQVDGQWRSEQELLRREVAGSDARRSVAGGRRRVRRSCRNPDRRRRLSTAGGAARVRMRSCRRTSPLRGSRCARVELHDDAWTGSGGFYTCVHVTPGRQYRASGAIRATQLAGPGIAYIAVYQFDAQGNYVDSRDFGVAPRAGRLADLRISLRAVRPRGPRARPVRVLPEERRCVLRRGPSVRSDRRALPAPQHGDRRTG